MNKKPRRRPATTVTEAQASITIPGFALEDDAKRIAWMLENGAALVAFGYLEWQLAEAQANFATKAWPPAGEFIGAIRAVLAATHPTASAEERAAVMRSIVAQLLPSGGRPTVEEKTRRLLVMIEQVGKDRPRWTKELIYEQVAFRTGIPSIDEVAVPSPSVR